MPKILRAKNLAQCEGGLYPAPIIFESISFEWEAPSIQVIMGASGIGKSTLIKSIGGVWPPLDGSLSVDDASLWNKQRTLQNRELLPHLGFAFQNNALFGSMKNIENLIFPHKLRFPNVSSKKRQSLALEWLAKVGLEENALSFPHELSGGMQKRLAIARTLILEPDFIFLDDPTAGLDPITSREMGKLINKLLEGKEVLLVVVTNDPERAKDWGPNIHFLHEGKFFLKDSPGWKEVCEIYS